MTDHEAEPPPPATGAWRPGDHPGRRRFAAVFDTEPLPLELGGEFGPVTVAYETWGEPSPARDNAVLVLHALTGDSHAAGEAGPGHPNPGWWGPLIGPGAPIDTDRWWVVCPNTLGGCQGTTGPASTAPDGAPWGSRFPAITTRDQVAVEAALARQLGILQWAAVVGGSMGGMRALEWGVMFPDRVARMIVLACGAAATAEQIALCAVQARAIRLDPGFAGGDYYDRRPGAGPARGLGLARRVGHITYRSEIELEGRFGRAPQDGEDPLADGRYAVESYLDHQADKLVRRFDANSYLVLSRTMDHHDVGRGRGGIPAALARVTAKPTIVAIDSDRLYPPRLQQELHAHLPGRPELHVVASPFGHDAFLIETEQVGKYIRMGLQG
ncbi:MAG TPA: homoserine O-acetyltransferase [Acidimicrobiales bacterium]|nr:homoserine O-acetyltransferase [Acidimicrobiales bacterium]